MLSKGHPHMWHCLAHLDGCMLQFTVSMHRSTPLPTFYIMGKVLNSNCMLLPGKPTDKTPPLLSQVCKRETETGMLSPSRSVVITSNLEMLSHDEHVQTMPASLLPQATSWQILQMANLLLSLAQIASYQRYKPRRWRRRLRPDDASESLTCKPPRLNC